MDKERLEALLEEATVDCYGEDEEFTGVMCTLGEQLRFPLKATVVGEAVEVVGIDERHSDLRRGVVARVRRGGALSGGGAALGRRAALAAQGHAPAAPEGAEH
jgi:hypothetical protein